MTPELLRFADDGSIPNNPRLPALLYRGALPPGDPAAAEACFARHGWPPAWRNGIYRHHHYHPHAHEALAIAQGRVQVQLGGAEGQVLDLVAGDVVVLPAGTGHCNLGASPDLLVVGAYPPGSDLAEFTGSAEEYAEALAAIPMVPDPETDPVTGDPWPSEPPPSVGGFAA
ncbi:MAG: cupin [Belnapia sp.]|nr:cupin [Belnapia sp.]